MKVDKTTAFILFPTQKTCTTDSLITMRVYKHETKHERSLPKDSISAAGRDYIKMRRGPKGNPFISCV